MPRSTKPLGLASGADARALADWASQHLVNRRDVWGAYIPPERRSDPVRKSYTAPAVHDRGHAFLTHDILSDHFAGRRVIGLHASDGATSRWFAFDFDCHAGDERTRAENIDASARLVDTLRTRGFTPLLEDSDGRGGLHVWVVLDAPAPTADVFALVDELRVSLNLLAETFPKQATIPPGRFGNWLRLPGRHHTRDHVSRVRVCDGRWLEGPKAVRAVLTVRLSPASRIPHAPAPRVALAYVQPIDWATRDRRLLAYVAKVDHGLGDGRKRAAFRLGAAFVHDFGLSQSEALQLLCAWNDHNAPALDTAVVAEILENAARYGRGGRAA